MLPILQDDLAEAKANFQRQTAALQRLFDTRYADTAEGERENETGVVYITEGDWTIRCEVRKRVDWNQDALNAILDEIERNGENAEDYATFKAFVPENNFKRWPKPIREKFEPARRVIGSSPSYSMRRA